MFPSPGGRRENCRHTACATAKPSRVMTGTPIRSLRFQRMSAPSIVPEPGYLLPEAMELLQRVKRREDLSDDEVLILAIAAAQSALAAYVEPGNRDANQTINKIMSVLDHTDVI